MASRKEEKERLRQERLEREAAASSKQQQRVKLMRVGAGVLGVLAVVAVIAVIALAGGGGNAEFNNVKPGKGFPKGALPAAAKIKKGTEADLQDAAKAANCVLKKNPNEGADHKEPSYKFKFDANPPTSGDHLPVPATDASYPEGAAPKAEELIHSMEHGRVLFQWVKGKISQQQLGSLYALYQDQDYHLILTENLTKMPFAVAATAWDRSLGCQQLDEATFKALRLFHYVFVDTGPERVE